MKNNVPKAQKILFFDDSWEHLRRILEIIQKRKPKDLSLGSNSFEWVADHLESWIDMESKNES